MVTLGRFSMAHFRPGERITQIHGTHVPAPVETGARDAVAFAMFHPAAALRSTDVERQSYDDIALLPRVLGDARSRRLSALAAIEPTELAIEPAMSSAALQPPSDARDDAPTLF